MRTVKDADVRKAEILDAAEQLFHEKGYAQATTGDILEKTGIARGTLYYHFKNKEEILYAVIDRHLDERKEKMQEIADNSSLDVYQKLFGLMRVQKESGIVAEGLHDIENAQLHQRSFTQAVIRLTPVFSQGCLQQTKKRYSMQQNI